MNKTERVLTEAVEGAQQEVEYANEQLLKRINEARADLDRAEHALRHDLSVDLHDVDRGKVAEAVRNRAAAYRNLTSWEYALAQVEEV